MKPGIRLIVNNQDALVPMIGRLVWTDVDGEKVKARITEVREMTTVLTVVSNTTLE